MQTSLQITWNELGFLLVARPRSKQQPLYYSSLAHYWQCLVSGYVQLLMKKNDLTYVRIWLHSPIENYRHPEPTWNTGTQKRWSIVIPRSHFRPACLAALFWTCRGKTEARIIRKKKLTGRLRISKYNQYGTDSLSLCKRETWNFVRLLRHYLVPNALSGSKMSSFVITRLMVWIWFSNWVEHGGTWAELQTRSLLDARSDAWIGCRITPETIVSHTMFIIPPPRCCQQKFCPWIVAARRWTAYINHMHV